MGYKDPEHQDQHHAISCIIHMKKAIDRGIEYLKKEKWIMIFLIMIPFFNDSYVSAKVVNDLVMDFLKIVSFSFLAFLHVREKKRLSCLAIILIIMEMWWLIATLLNYPVSERRVYYKMLIDIINAFSVALCVEHFIDEPIALLKGTMLNMELALYPNLIYVLLDYPGKRVYLLGADTAFVLWLLPAVCISALYILFTGKKLRASILITACITTLLKTRCATAVVAFMGMAAALLIGLLLYRKQKIYLFPLLIVSLLANLFVLFVYTGGSFPILDFFIEKILGKSVTFTERTVIWEEAMRMIREKPFFGHGFRPQINVSNSFADSFQHSHNQILQQLNAGGIVGLLLFAVFHIELCRKADKTDHSRARLLVVAAVFAVSITYITEAYKKFFRFYLVFFIAYHVGELLKNAGREKIE